MAEPYHDPMRGPYVRERSYSAIGLTLGLALIAAAVFVGLAYFGMGGHLTGDAPTASNPPAVTTAPAPAARVPAPAPEETTGRTAPKAR